MNYEDTLCHWNERKHKYIAKVKTKNGYYRYFYSKEEYQTFLKENKGKTKNISKGYFGKPYDFGAESRNPYHRDPSPIDLFLNDRKIDFISKACFNRAISRLYNGEGDFKYNHKYIAKAKLSNGKYRYFYNQAEYDAFLKRKEYQENEPDFMKDVPELSEDESWIDNLLRVNSEKYNSDVTGPYSYNLNCMMCTATYELIQRGYKVSASPMDVTKLRFGETESVYEMFKDPKPVYFDENNKVGSSPNWDGSIKLYDFIKSNNPPNSRGNVMLHMKGGIGHSVAYETDSKGNVRLVDGQVAGVRDTREAIDAYNKFIDNICLVRTDNLEFKEGILDCVEFKGK